MIIFKVFGIEFKVSFLFLCLISWSLLYDKNKILLIYLCSYFFHEISHILLVYLFSGRVKTITFTSFGISIKKTTELSIVREILILSAGCLGNLLLILIFLCLDLQLIVLINLFIIIFNLIPLENFDGGQILKLLFDDFLKTRNLYKIFRIILILAVTLLLIYFFIMTMYIQKTKFIFIVLLLSLSYFFENKA